MNTEFPWGVPGNWSWIRIGDVTDVVGGGTPSTTRAEYWEHGDIAWITPADLSGYNEVRIRWGARSITGAGLAGSGARLMPAGTVLMSSRAPVGYVVIASQPVSTNQGFKSFPPTPALLPEFLYYYLIGNRQLVLVFASGTTFLEVSGKKAAMIPVPVPPLAEQRRIVAAIEEHMSRLDAAVAGLKRVQAQLPRYRAAVLKAAVETERGGNAVGSRLMRPLADVAEVQLGKMASPKSRSGVGSRPYLRNANVRWGRIETDDLLWMDFDEREVRKYELRDGDVLVCEGGEPGRAAVWRGTRSDLLYQKALHRVRVNRDQLNPDFLVYQLHHAALWGGLERLLTGSTIKHLTREMLLRFPAYVPSLAVQEGLVSEIERRESIAGAVEREVDSGLAHAARIRQAILARAFSGQLVPQDPNDEPASMLLERMKIQRASAPTSARKVSSRKGLAK